MAKARPIASESKGRKMRPALSPEARENQMISLTLDVVEEQLRNRTASSQVLTHYLKLATMKEQLERERLMEENKLLRAKTEAIESAKRVEELYSEAIDAMRRYSGHAGGGDEDDGEWDD